MADFDVPFIDELIKQARASDMTVHTRDSPHYDEVRQVKNARIDKRPYAIAECKNKNDFAFWLKGLETQDIPISIRSGGHHHEGMSSNDGGIVLMSVPDEAFELDEDRSHVWLGAGIKLGEVIHRLGSADRMMPTGGCASVNVGGLTHGGGWGMAYRYFGATIDALRAVEMVLPNGDIVTIGDEGLLAGETSLNVDLADVFWAVRGGGGGNFGVVTRFRFEVYKLPHLFTKFTLQFSRSKMQRAAETWVALCGSAEIELNTFARMTVTKHRDEFSPSDPPFVVGGRFYGDREACRRALSDLADLCEPDYCSLRECPLLSASDVADVVMLAGKPELEELNGVPIPAQAYALQPGSRGRKGPAETCDPQPEPHKVCSLMPSAGVGTVIAELADFIDDSTVPDGVNLYVSLHGMGGQAKANVPSLSAFPWRDRDWMLQAQAWWNHDDFRGDEKDLLAWIEEFRTRLTPLSDGAFINFPDENQEASYYYGDSWDRLQFVKTFVDPEYRLAFDLGIPPR